MVNSVIIYMCLQSAKGIKYTIFYMYKSSSKIPENIRHVVIRQLIYKKG